MTSPRAAPTRSPLLPAALLGLVAFAALAPRPAAAPVAAPTPMPAPAPMQALDTPDDDTPRLVVVVCVDQLCSEYFDRFQHVLGEGGFRRLIDDGLAFPRGTWAHTVTKTAPGHASLATGCLPAKAGIIGNEWFDVATRSKMYSCGDRAASVVGSVSNVAPASVSPANLEAPTLGDLLQTADDDAIVMSFSLKDRSALLMGGARSDGSYWYDKTSGTWVTSDRLRSELPGWLVELNAGDPLAPYREMTWTRSVSSEDALRYAGPDARTGEPSPGGALGPTFPHPFPENAAAATGFARSSPFGDLILRDAVLAALGNEELGQDEIPDLLWIGFSALDGAGHAFGPLSQEVMDMFVRLDQRLAELMAALDEHVGEERWTLALTSDHGVAQLPEKSGGVRIMPRDVWTHLDARLTAAFPDDAPDRWVLAVYQPGVYLDRESIEAKGLDFDEVAKRAAKDLPRLSGVAMAATREQLRTASEPELQALARDVHDVRSGDVLFLLERDTVYGAPTGTNHGSHYEYDQRVPVMLYGAGIRTLGQRSRSAVSPMDLAPTLGRLIGLDMDVLETMDGSVLHAALIRSGL